MSNNNGYIKLFRQVQENQLWTAETFTKGQAWIDLLLMASYKESMVITNGKQEYIKRGVVIHSISYFSNRWKWSPKTTRCFLDYLIKHEMIEKTIVYGRTHIYILNYETYQGDCNEGHTKNQYLQGLERDEGHKRGTPRGTQNGTINPSNNKALEVTGGTQKGKPRGKENKESKNIYSVCKENNTQKGEVGKIYLSDEEYKKYCDEFGEDRVARAINNCEKHYTEKGEVIIDSKKALKNFLESCVQEPKNKAKQKLKSNYVANKNSFMNFAQRQECDFDALEKKLTGA